MRDIVCLIAAEPKNGKPSMLSSSAIAAAASIGIKVGLFHQRGFIIILSSKLRFCFGKLCYCDVILMYYLLDTTLSVQLDPVKTSVVSLESLPGVIARLSQDTNYGFATEFESLETGKEFPREVFLS